MALKSCNRIALTFLAAAMLAMSLSVAIDNHPITRATNSKDGPIARAKACPVCFVRSLLSVGVTQAAAFVPQIENQPFYFILTDGLSAMILSVILSPISSRAPPTVSL